MIIHMNMAALTKESAKAVWREVYGTRCQMKLLTG